MALVKSSTLLFDSITVPGNSFSDRSAYVDLTDAVDLSVGYKFTFDAASTAYGVTIYMYSEPSGSDPDWTPGQYANPADRCDIPGDLTSQGHTVESTYRMDHSGKYVKFRVYNHDDVSVTGLSLWAHVQKP